MTCVNKKIYFFIIYVVNLSLLFLFLFCACSSKAQNSMPPMPDASIFLGEIDNNKYKTIAPLQSPQMFRWNFSERKKYSYIYFKKSIRRDYSNLPRIELSDSTTSVDLNAELIVDSLGDQTANLILKNTEAAVKMGIPKETPEGSDSIIKNAPSTVIHGVQEDGRTKDGFKNRDFLFGLLFPLPPKALKIGGHVKINESMPINLAGSIFSVTGESIVFLTGYVKIKDRVCARFVTITNISNINSAHYLEGNNKFVTKGKSVYYFDIANRCFIAGNASILISIRFEDKSKGKRIAYDDDSLISINFKSHKFSK